MRGPMIRIGIAISCIVVLSGLFGCTGDEPDGEEGTSPGSTDTGWSNAQLADFCELVASMNCAEAPSDISEQLMSVCMAEFGTLSEEGAHSGCSAQIFAELDCVQQNLVCPSTWDESEALLDNLILPAEDACAAEEQAATKCTGELECTDVVPSRGGLRVDLDGDGSLELLDPDVEDRRVYCSYKESSDRLVVEFPAVLVPAGAEQFTCMYGTWTGPDMGIVHSVTGSDPMSNHHFIVQTLEPNKTGLAPDGKMFPCEAGQHGGFTIFFGVGKGVKGLGTRLRSGQRYYVELHNLNPFPYPILVNATRMFELAPLESLDGLMESFIMGPEDIEIPPGNFHIKTDCVWPQDTSILTVAAHMHVHGIHYALDWTSTAGTQRVFELDPWLEKYYQAEQPTKSWAVGEFEVKAGDTFTTHCTWNNPKSTVVYEPEEMCNTFGVAYPLEVPINCKVETQVVLE